MPILNAGRRKMKWSRMMAATIIGCTGLTTHAQPLDLPMSIWQPLFTLKAGFGYKDNLTLAHTATESSPFFASGLEAFLLRLPKDGTEYTFFLSAEDRRYLSHTSVDHEDLISAHAQLKHQFGDAGEGSLTVEYAYQDQIEDVSVTETNLEAIRVRGNTLAARPALKLNFPGQCWASLQLAPTRQWFAAPLDDFFEFGPGITFGRTYGNQSEVALAYEPSYRNYDSDPQISSTGEPVPGTHRAFTRQDILLGWVHYWDPVRRWRSTTRLSYRINRDNGSGFFDYARFSFAEQLRFRTRVWDCSAQVRVSQYGYDVQEANPGSSEKRERTEISAGLHFERSLTKSIRLVATYEFERTLSNITLENYTASTVTGSLQWDF
jgi:hypothetical protein